MTDPTGRGGETVVLHRMVRDGVDGRGQDRWIEQPPGGLEVPGCSIWPEGSTERTAGADQVHVDLTITVPRDTLPAEAGGLVKPTDEITVRGQRYAVIGEPGDYRNPRTGRTRPFVIRLEKVTG